METENHRLFPIATSPDVWMYATEAALRGLLAGIAWISLIYCYGYGIHHQSSFQGPLAILIASLTNLPFAVYQTGKGIYLIFRSLQAVLRSQTCSAQGRLSALQAAPQWFLADADWMEHFSGQAVIDTEQSDLISPDIPAWKTLPYPEVLDQMASAALIFNQLYNGDRILPQALAKQRHQSSMWLVRLLLLSALANVSAFWFGHDAADKAVLMAVMAVMFLALLWWMVVQMTATRVRLQILGCFGGEPFQTRRLLRKRLVLLLTQRFGGPYPFLATARQSGEDVTHYASLFRLPPVAVTLFLFLPIGSWLAHILPFMSTQWMVYFPLLAFVACLFSAFLFFWDDKTSTYFFVDIPQYPANVWAFRYFSDVIRRLYAD
ncbi:MAG: hypothetical protein PHE96_08875 [Methylococcales bacterium]|uniref:hypothetical protein n=1 Tax=Acidithiobacillus thiooxidans TaxID=930 RepID=UPI0004E15241|nr:hypothetical protein [Acidithiobacillus thiooxidans]MDD2801557.1 hypothetical protein [Methylococcales bacterium]